MLFVSALAARSCCVVVAPADDQPGAVAPNA
jgi:hypothetical protein